MNPIRITPRPQTLIDNTLYDEIKSKIIAGNNARDISDHLIQFTTISGKCHTEHLNDDICRRNYKTLNHDKCKKDLNKTDWDTLLSGIILMLHMIISFRKLKTLKWPSG